MCLLVVGGVRLREGGGVIDDAHGVLSPFVGVVVGAVAWLVSSDR